MLDASSKNILQGFNLNIKIVVQSGPKKRSEYSDTFLRELFVKIFHILYNMFNEKRLNADIAHQNYR